jgi:hypothetical protein
MVGATAWWSCSEGIGKERRGRGIPPLFVDAVRNGAPATDTEVYGEAPPCTRVRCGEEDGVAALVSLPGGSVKQPHARSAVARAVDWGMGHGCQRRQVEKGAVGLRSGPMGEWAEWVDSAQLQGLFLFFIFSAFFFIPIIHLNLNFEFHLSANSSSC